MTSAFGDQKVPMMTSANNVGEGWHPIIRELEKKLNALDPEYELDQVKEKFGGLRYYAHTTKDGIVVDQFQYLIDEAEEQTFHICEMCGEPGECHATTGLSTWLKTLCPRHRAEDEERYTAERKRLST